MTRLFVSDIEDKSWFYDKAFWQAYLSMLMTQRFNRFSLTLGLGYDSPKHVLDSYFIFAYPYLVSVPGYRGEGAGIASRRTGTEPRDAAVYQQRGGPPGAALSIGSMGTRLRMRKQPRCQLHDRRA